MLKLPLCPYCGARFLYPDVKKMKSKVGTCPHCGKSFYIGGKSSRAALFFAAFIVMVGFNILLLNISSMNIWLLTAVTIVGVIITYFLIPYTVRYKQL